MNSSLQRTTILAIALAVLALLTMVAITSVAQETRAHTDPEDTGKPGPPEAPQDLRTTEEHGHDRVTLRWDAAPDGFSQQQLGMRDVDQDNTLSWTTIDSTLTSYTVTGLEPHNTYAFRVRVLRDGAYYQSNYVNFETAHDPPPTPTSTPVHTPTPEPTPEATPAPTPTPIPPEETNPPVPVLNEPSDVTTSSLTLSWTVPDTTDVDEFTVGVHNTETDEENNFTYQSVTDTDGNAAPLATVHTVTGLTAGTTYSFKVKAEKTTDGVSTYSYSNEVPATTDDHPATTQTTGTLAVEASTQGAVERAGDRDWFAATLEAGTSYQFELHTSRSRGLGDPMIHGIHNSNGELLPNTSNDNASWFYWYSQVFFTPQTAGTYYVSAGASGEGVGTYLLSVEIIEDDYAANTGTTGTLSTATPATGEVNSAHEEDWFRATMDGTKRYLVELKGAAQGGGTLAAPEIVGVFDAQGALVPGTGSGGAVQTTLDFNPQGPGNYYISAGASGAGTGTYTIEVTAIGRSAALDLGDLTSPAKAHFLEGHIDADLNDDAWYKFTLTESTAIEFGLRQQDLDADLLIEDEDGQALHESRRDGRANEAVRANLAPGTYYVHVHAQETGVNDYVLRYGPPSQEAAETDTDATRAQARALQFFDGQAQAGGNVDGISDAVDYLKFTLTTNKTAALVLTGHENRDTLHRDINMTLENVHGGAIARSEESGQTGERIEIMLRPGDYYLRLSAYEAGASPYHLAATLSEPPKLSIGPTSVYEAEDAVLSYPVTLDPPSSRTVTVGWNTYDANNTATPEVDFRSASETLTFPPGETLRHIQVDIIDDDIEDSGEVVIVNLHRPTQAVIKQGTAVGTILNQDVLANIRSETTLTMDAEQTKSYLVLQPQIVLGRMELLLGVVEVKWWQLSGTKYWKWPGGPKALRKFMGALRSGFTVRNPAGGRWSI